MHFSEPEISIFWVSPIKHPKLKGSAPIRPPRVSPPKNNIRRYHSVSTLRSRLASSSSSAIFLEVKQNRCQKKSVESKRYLGIVGACVLPAFQPLLSFIKDFSHPFSYMASISYILNFRTTQKCFHPAISIILCLVFPFQRDLKIFHDLSFQTKTLYFQNM